jgi:hypothetical protein
MVSQVHFIDTFNAQRLLAVAGLVLIAVMSGRS